MLNFSISELIRSTTAQQHNINNMPTDARTYDNMLILIAECLQPIRDKLKKPMVITSGYRNANLNYIVGGSDKSYHLKGQAVDFCVPNMSVESVVEFIRNSGIAFTELIEEHGKAGSWVHIAYDKNNLCKAVKLYRNGKYERVA